MSESTQGDRAGDPAGAPATEQLGLTLGGGGARAAYQVGVLRFLARRYPDLKIPIITGVSAGAINAALLASHHGSKTSCTDPFLRAVQPDVCVISCGYGNWFGFPHDETLERLRNAGCRIIRIDQVGAVEIEVGSNDVEIRSYCGLNDEVREGADRPVLTNPR